MRAKKNTSMTDDQSSSGETAARRRRVDRRKKKLISTTNDKVNANTSNDLNESHKKMPVIHTDLVSLVSGNMSTNKIGSYQNISNNYCKDSSFIEHTIKKENITTQNTISGNMACEEVINSENNLSKCKHLTLNHNIETPNILTKKQSCNLIENSDNYGSVTASFTESSLLRGHKYYSYSDKEATKDGDFGNIGHSQHYFCLENGEENNSDSEDSNPLILNCSDDDDSSSICDEDKDKLQDLLEEILHSRQKAFFRSPTVIEVLQNLADDLQESS